MRIKVCNVIAEVENEFSTKLITTFPLVHHYNITICKRLQVKRFLTKLTHNNQTYSQGQLR